MKSILSVLLLATVFFVSAQDNILVKGFVLDKDNRQPLSMASVQVKNSQLGALTEDNGYFELPVPKKAGNDSLRISFIGYNPAMFSIVAYNDKDTLKILLATQVELKPEVVVSAMSARRVLQQAINNLKKNLYTDSVIQSGLYRQYHKENGTYVRLIEADVSIAFNTRSPYLYAMHEQVQINKDRRSENYETNGDVHGDHLVDLLKENPFSYNRGSFLNPKNLDFFSPKFESEDSVRYVLKTQYKESTSDKLEQARLWIDKETFAILQIEIDKFPNPYYNKSRYRRDSRWELVNEKDIIELDRINGKFFVSSLQRVYNHHVLNRQTGVVDYIVEETFELYFEEFDTTDIGERIAKGLYTNMTSLYTYKHPYDEDFWKNYELVEDYELPGQVKADLEHNKKLIEQFRNMDK